MKDCFKKSDGSPSYANNLLRVACDNSSSCSSDLVYSLLTEFNRYVTDHRITFVPSIEEQRDALNCVLVSRYYDILPLVCNVFKIDGKQARIKEIVDELVQHQKFIEVGFGLLLCFTKNCYILIDVLFYFYSFTRLISK